MLQWRLREDPIRQARDILIPLSGCVFAGAAGRRTIYGRSLQNDLTHIDDAPRGSRGFTCPDCGSELIVRKGDVKAHHFAHKNIAECASAGESALHRLAKALLLEDPSILLPELVVEGEPCVPARTVTLATIEEETWEGNFRPDLRATMRSIDAVGAEIVRTLFIEIHVTHKVDSEKLARIIAQGHSAIEIDLSGVRRDLTGAELGRMLRSEAPRTWLFNRLEAKHRGMIEAKRAAARQLQEREAVQKERRRAAAVAAAERARLRPPAQPDDALAAWVERQRIMWEAIGQRGLLHTEADDAIFDLPPEAWRIIALGGLAPWNKPQAAHAWIGGFDTLARRAASAVARAKGLKREFAKGAERGKGTGFDVVRAYLRRAFGWGKGEWHPSEDVPIRTALEDHSASYSELKDLHASVRSLQRLLTPHGLSINGGGRGLDELSDTAFWISRQRRHGPNFSVSLARGAITSLIHELGSERAKPGPGHERFVAAGISFTENGTDRTESFLRRQREERSTRLAKETEARMTAEIEAIAAPMQRSLTSLGALGPWPASVKIEQFRTRADIDLTVREATEEYFMQFGVLLQDRLENATARDRLIARALKTILDVVDGLDVPMLRLGLRNILVREVIRCTSDDAGWTRLGQLVDAIGKLGGIARDFAAIELAGQDRLHGASAQDFAWRAITSKDPRTNLSVLQAVLEGKGGEAHAIAKKISLPFLKPPWIRKSVPRIG